MVVDIDERGNAIAGFAGGFGGLAHASAGKITNGFGTVLISAKRDHAVELIDEFII
jgi:hypothetical protein